MKKYTNKLLIVGAVILILFNILFFTMLKNSIESGTFNENQQVQEY